MFEEIKTAMVLPQYNTVVTYQEYREWRRQSVAQMGWGRAGLVPLLICYCTLLFWNRAYEPHFKVNSLLSTCLLMERLFDDATVPYTRWQQCMTSF